MELIGPPFGGGPLPYAIVCCCDVPSSSSSLPSSSSSSLPSSSLPSSSSSSSSSLPSSSLPSSSSSSVPSSSSSSSSSSSIGCCCEVIDGYKIEMTGILNGSCSDCTGLNSAYDVPKTSSGEGWCEGTLGLGITCGLPVPGVLSWRLECNPDGSHTLETKYELGALTKDTLVRTIDLPAGTGCCDLGGSGRDSSSNNNCNFDSATFSNIQPYSSDGDPCPEYGALGFRVASVPVRSLTEGPGTELQNLISWFVGNAKAGNCSRCKTRVQQMNQWGSARCLKNMARIKRWLRHSAAQKSLPYSDRLVEILIRKAIDNAKKKGL